VTETTAIRRSLSNLPDEQPHTFMGVNWWPGGELMTKPEVVDLINSRFVHLGDLTRWAKEIGVGAGSVSCAARGQHIVPGILDALGLEAVIMYRRTR